jgi:pilus assembly protein Flp/PilA
MNNLIAKFGKDESGATAIEYALIAAIVGIGIISVLQLVRTNLRDTFTTVSDALATANADQG